MIDMTIKLTMYFVFNGSLWTGMSLPKYYNSIIVFSRGNCFPIFSSDNAIGKLFPKEKTIIGLVHNISFKFTIIIPDNDYKIAKPCHVDSNR